MALSKECEVVRLKKTYQRSLTHNHPLLLRLQKSDNICNNACEVFNSRTKEHRDKGIITLLEEVRMFALMSIAKKK
ncbi:hypothetical protein PIB30_027990 [Stylosanthes scabra]|uniref:Uncharacterized protein n=1 Tax=Stylosanthes scabra TaxID=79078 RepID=A0ABU6VC76_9FABA|nr:hypothetical protein [Stylosanthes scabra]